MKDHSFYILFIYLFIYYYFFKLMLNFHSFLFCFVRTVDFNLTWFHQQTDGGINLCHDQTDGEMNFKTRALNWKSGQIQTSCRFMISDIMSTLD